MATPSSTDAAQPATLAPEPNHLPMQQPEPPASSALAINIAEDIEGLLLTSGLDVQKIVVSPYTRVCNVV